MSYEREREVALEAAQLASQAILERYATFKAIADAPADISTEADRQAQDIIVTHLRHAFPQDAFSAEEATPALADAPHAGPRLWIVDPIDGSRGFARKNDEFAVMVAFLDQGTVAVGVVQEPARGRLTWAVRGGGCWRRDQGGEPVRCRVSAVDTLPAAALTQSRSRDPSVPSGQVTALKPARVVEAYSAGLKMALVARGEVEIYVNRYLAFHDWDIAAGHILIEEAGGMVTGLRGETLRYGLQGAWQRHGVLATNRRLHSAALKALEAIL
jgi:3'(2'), 5'-bisphosphate nucleotidase